jgi:hypothetical protein
MPLVEHLTVDGRRGVVEDGAVDVVAFALDVGPADVQRLDLLSLLFSPVLALWMPNPTHGLGVARTLASPATPLLDRDQSR